MPIIGHIAEFHRDMTMWRRDLCASRTRAARKLAQEFRGAGEAGIIRRR